MNQPSCQEESSSSDNPIPIHLQSRLRLFLSIDLTGSTALKQGRLTLNSESEHSQHINNSVRWRDPMLLFYQRFQEIFSLRLSNYNKTIPEQAENGHHNLPKLWKAAGDELIYSQLITHSYQAYWTVQAWITASKEFRNELRSKFPSLDVKMTAWVAGFPVINAEIVLEPHSESYTETGDMLVKMLEKLKYYYESSEDSNKQQLLDFIGPSMDIGFRLCNLSSKRQMSISIELAYILANVRKKLISCDQNINKEANTNSHELPILPELKLKYAGRKELKGVLDGRMYPVFWLDTANENDELESAEDQIIKKHDVSPDQCINLVIAFIKDINNPLLVWQPYIDSDTSGTLPSGKPPCHDDIIKRWEEEYHDHIKIKEVRQESEHKNNIENNTTIKAPLCNIL